MKYQGCERNPRGIRYRLSPRKLHIEITVIVLWKITADCFWLEDQFGYERLIYKLIFLFLNLNVTSVTDLIMNR